MGSQVMPVAKWELWSVAVMLIEAHGDNAEAVARDRLTEAEADGHLGDTVVWEEIEKLLPKVRAEQASKF